MLGPVQLAPSRLAQSRLAQSRLAQSRLGQCDVNATKRNRQLRQAITTPTPASVVCMRSLAFRSFAGDESHASIVHGPTLSVERDAKGPQLLGIDPHRLVRWVKKFIGLET